MMINWSAVVDLQMQQYDNLNCEEQTKTNPKEAAKDRNNTFVLLPNHIARQPNESGVIYSCASQIGATDGHCFRPKKSMNFFATIIYPYASKFATNQAPKEEFFVVQRRHHLHHRSIWDRKK